MCTPEVVWATCLLLNGFHIRGIECCVCVQGRRVVCSSGVWSVHLVMCGIRMTWKGPKKHGAANQIQFKDGNFTWRVLGSVFGLVRVRLDVCGVHWDALLGHIVLSANAVRQQPWSNTSRQARATLQHCCVPNSSAGFRQKASTWCNAVRQPALQYSSPLLQTSTSCLPWTSSWCGTFSGRVGCCSGLRLNARIRNRPGSRFAASGTRAKQVALRMDHLYAKLLQTVTRLWQIAVTWTKTCISASKPLSQSSRPVGKRHAYIWASRLRLDDLSHGLISGLLICAQEGGRATQCYISNGSTWSLTAPLTACGSAPMTF